VHLCVLIYRLQGQLVWSMSNVPRMTTLWLHSTRWCLRRSRSIIHHYYHLQHYRDIVTVSCGIIMACAIATSCCISDVPSQWENQRFDPPLLRHFSTDLSETQNQERYLGYNPACKIWLCGTTGRGSVKMVNFGLLLVLSFFCTLRVASRSHRRTHHDQWGLKMHVFVQGSVFWGSRW